MKDFAPITLVAKLPNLDGRDAETSREATQWYGIVTQTGTPRSALSVLHAALVKAVHSPQVSDRFLADGAEPFTNTSEEFRAFIKAETDRWAPIIREIGQQ